MPQTKSSQGHCGGRTSRGRWRLSGLRFTQNDVVNGEEKVVFMTAQLSSRCSLVQLSTTSGTSKARDLNEVTKKQLTKPPVWEAHVPWLPPPTNRRWVSVNILLVYDEFFQFCFRKKIFCGNLKIHSFSDICAFPVLLDLNWRPFQCQAWERGLLIHCSPFPTTKPSSSQSVWSGRVCQAWSVWNYRLWGAKVLMSFFCRS